MKHYYNDNGILQFDHNRDLLVELAKAVNLNQMVNEHDRKMMRAELLNKAIEVQYDHSIYQSLPTSIGGSLTYDEWKERTEDDPITNVFKRMILDAIQRDFMAEEFMLIAWSAICELQITFLLSGDTD